MQKHWDVMRSDNAGDQWTRGQRESADRFRVPDRCARARTGDDLRGADQERLGAFSAGRQAAGLSQPDAAATNGKRLTNGLPQKDCYVNVLRDAMAVDSLDDAAFTSARRAARSMGRRMAAIPGSAIVRDLPAVLVGRSADAAMIRSAWCCPIICALWRRSATRCSWRFRRRSPLVRVLDALEARYPVLRGTIRDHGTLKRRPFVRFFACEEDLSHESPDTPLPAAIATGDEPFFVVGAMAGG